MIQDAQARSDIVAAWATIRHLSKTGNSVMLPPSYPSFFERWPVALINLPLVLAYCSLEDVLDQLVVERHFSCQSSKLWPMMIASRSALPWQDYAQVDTGRKARNKLAHE